MDAVADAECVTVNRFTVDRIAGSHIRLYYDILDVSVVAVLGKSLTNVERVHVGDKARVTMALMPNKKTLYCVKASILKSKTVSQLTLSITLHRSINSFSSLRQSISLRIIRSRGLDANDTYVGIGRLVQAYNLLKRANRGKPLGTTAEICTIAVNGIMVAVRPPVSTAKISETSKDERPQQSRLADVQLIFQSLRELHQNSRERAEVRMAPRSAPLLPTPSGSPDVGMSEETTITNDSSKEGKRSREQPLERRQLVKRKKIEEKVVELSKTEESARVKRMGRREIIERMKNAILTSPEILKTMANIDAELLTEIVQR